MTTFMKKSYSCPVEFSSNPSQTHPKKLIKVFRITRATGNLGGLFSGLELNSAGHRHSRTDVAYPWCRPIENSLYSIKNITSMESP